MIGYQRITVWLVVVAGLLFGILAPRLRSDNSSVDPTIRGELRTEAQINFDAPLMEVVTWPVYRIHSYNNGTAVIRLYSWFGVRVAQVTLTGCVYGKPGNFNPNFGCYDGGYVTYGLGF